MTRRRLPALLALAAFLLLASATPAEAHAGDEIGPTNYDSIIKRVSPDVPGVEVRSVDLATRMELRNDTGTTVVVLGYEDEPYLRVDADGVWENRRSPATYLNATKDGGTAVPDEATADAEPQWTKISDGDTARWHDHRAHWMASNDPPAVRQDSSRAHVVLPDWKIPLLVDGKPVAVTGDLVWSPGPSLAPYLVAAIALAAGVVGVAWVSRGRRRVVVGLACALMVAASVALSVGEAVAPELTGSPLPRLLVSGALVLLIGWAGGLIAAWWLLGTKPAEGIVVAGVAGLTVTLGSGLGFLAHLNRPHIAFAWGDDLARMLVVGNLALGAGIGLTSLLAVRTAWFERQAPA